MIIDSVFEKLKVKSRSGDNFCVFLNFHLTLMHLFSIANLQYKDKYYLQKVLKYIDKQH